MGRNFLRIPGTMIPAFFLCQCLSMGNMGFDFCAQGLEVFRKMVGIEAGLAGQHSTSDIDSDRCRNNRLFEGDHGSNAGSKPPMGIRHRTDTFDNRKRCNIMKLFRCKFFKLTYRGVPDSDFLGEIPIEVHDDKKPQQ